MSLSNTIKLWIYSIGLSSCFFSEQSISAQTEFASGLILEFPVSGDYTKTGSGFELKGVGYSSDVSAVRVGVGYLGYQSTTQSLLATAIDESFSDPDSIFVDNKIRRQQFRIDLQYARFLTGSYSPDMNAYAYGGLRLAAVNQRFRAESFSDDLYQIAPGQTRNGFELNTQFSFGFGYEIAIDFFDFIYLEVEVARPLFYLRQIDDLDNAGWRIGLNLGFRSNFGN